jgi:hopene-associated glycosyltransferase HpnB
MFWMMRERDDGDLPPPVELPPVVAIVPARDEVDVVARAIASLFMQDYGGSFRVLLVDDLSSDGTADEARRAARAHGSVDRLEIVSGTKRPAGWTGKLWAMQQGVACMETIAKPEYVLFTDADIEHASDNLRRLVSRAEHDRLALVSLMATLRCETAVERLLIPAFVFFFAMVFPFSWVNDSAKRTAAAAGGCMLVRRESLIAAGGLEMIASAIIDDCALARIVKQQGPIWLGLSQRVQSIRPYGSLREISRMVTRSAYAQLRYSPFYLCGTVLGMSIAYVLPIVLSIFADGSSRLAGLFAWLLMTLSYGPILFFYGLSPLWGPALPLIGALYATFTIQSAVQHWRGQGGMWKGRAQAIA